MEPNQRLVKIACQRCRIDALWTDDPRSFLQTVCVNPHACSALLRDEPFMAEPEGATTLPAQDTRPDPNFEIRTLLNVILGFNSLIAEHLSTAGDHAMDSFVEGTRRGVSRALALLAPPTGDSESEPAETAAPPRNSHRPGILVVEDDPDTQQVMKAMLRKRYKVRVASSAAAARKMLKRHGGRVSLILMDLSLKGEEDGLALTRSLRAEERWRTIPIIVTTAHSMPEHRRGALAAGCDDFLSKPLHFGRLLSLIARYTPSA